MKKEAKIALHSDVRRLKDRLSELRPYSNEPLVVDALEKTLDLLVQIADSLPENTDA